MDLLFSVEFDCTFHWLIRVNLEAVALRCYFPKFISIPDHMRSQLLVLNGGICFICQIIVNSGQPNQ